MCSKLAYRRQNGPKITLGYYIYHQYHCLCYPGSEEALKIVKKSFIANFDSHNKCTYCGQSFYPCLVKIFFQRKALHMGVGEKLTSVLQ